LPVIGRYFEEFPMRRLYATRLALLIGLAILLLAALFAYLQNL
jgi:hypothetical protein